MPTLRIIFVKFYLQTSKLFLLQVILTCVDLVIQKRIIMRIDNNQPKLSFKANTIVKTPKGVISGLRASVFAFKQEALKSTVYDVAFELPDGAGHLIADLRTKSGKLLFDLREELISLSKTGIPSEKNKAVENELSKQLDTIIKSKRTQELEYPFYE